jgi:hypothetical protein
MSNWPSPMPFVELRQHPVQRVTLLTTRLKPAETASLRFAAGMDAKQRLPEQSVVGPKVGCAVGASLWAVGGDVGAKVGAVVTTGAELGACVGDVGTEGADVAVGVDVGA